MGRQFLRKCLLSLAGSSNLTIPGGGPKDLRIEFAIGASTLMAPNQSRFRITNPNPQTVASFKGKEFSTVTLLAGYEDNCAQIYSGDIKQTLTAHAENIVDSYIDIFAYENGNAYQQARVGKTLSAGWTPRDKVNLALEAMKPLGISGLGFVNVDLDSPKYPRGRPFIGMARDLLRQVALSAGGHWSMHDGKVHIINPDKPIDSGGPIVLNSQTGLVGFGQQTENGVVVRCLINPAIRVHSKVKIDESSIILAERKNGPFDGPSETNRNLDNAGRIASDGTYTVLFMEVEGDTRGQSYYQTLTCLADINALNKSEIDSGYF